MSLLRPLSDRLVRALRSCLLPPSRVREIFAIRLARAASEPRQHLVFRLPASTAPPMIDSILERMNQPRGERGSYNKSKFQSTKRPLSMKVDGGDEDSDEARSTRPFKAQSIAQS